MKRVYFLPDDLLERPELRPLVEMGMVPGDAIVWRGPRRWYHVVTPRVSHKAELALRMIEPTPLPSDPVSEPPSSEPSGVRVFPIQDGARHRQYPSLPLGLRRASSDQP